jgi:putative aldouronate transport system substrate-binding protein
LSSDLDEKARKYFEYSAKPDTYYLSGLRKFQFDSTNFKAEVANISSKTDPFIQLLKDGQMKDWQTEVTKMKGELDALGMDKLRAELKKQLQTYLDNGGK